MRPHTRALSLFLIIVVSGCAPPQAAKPALPPLPTARFDYTPAPPCDVSGSAKITFAVVSPRWTAPGQATSSTTVQRQPVGQPRVLASMGPAMQADFFELLTCRGYLTKGPFDSFEAMVYPDREASQLLLEPELQITFVITGLGIHATNLFGQAIPATASMTGVASGNVSVSGRVTLTIKEPVTNTRMWTKSIDVPPTAFTFTTEHEYQGAMQPAVLRSQVLEDDGLRRELQPRLESMYQSVLKAAESYLNKQELTTVAHQATDVRKKAAIGVPPRE